MVETKTNNMAKSNYHSAFYPQILELFRRIRMPSEVIREDLVMSPYDTTMERRIRMDLSTVGMHDDDDDGDDENLISVDGRFEEVEEAEDSNEAEDIEDADV